MDPNPLSLRPLDFFDFGGVQARQLGSFETGAVRGTFGPRRKTVECRADRLLVIRLQRQLRHEATSACCKNRLLSRASWVLPFPWLC